jgi:hypothetical protein
MTGRDDPLLDPNAISWDVLRAEFEFTDEEEAMISQYAEEMLARTRAPGGENDATG